MTIIDAVRFGVKTETDITLALAQMIKQARETQGEKLITFPKGVYYLDAEKCEEHMLYISNTVGDKEFKNDEIPHKNAVPFYFHRVDDFIFDANDSTFIIKGKVTNAAFINCNNVTFQNLEIAHERPDMNEYTVEEVSKHSVIFKMDKDTRYKVKGGKMYLSLNAGEINAAKNAACSWWIGLIRKATPDKVERVASPLMNCYWIKDLGNGRIKAYYPDTKRFLEGDKLYNYDVRRQFAGIFISRSKNITIKNVKQRFDYSLALIAQDTENITIDSVEFAPEKNGTLKLSSVADFIQISTCRGKVVIKDSYFDGAGDDCLNVHGIHFKIIKRDGDKLFLRFMHPQTHGFNPLHVGDKIAYINPETMLETGRAEITKTDLISETDFKIRVSNFDNAKVGYCIENISACPELEFVNNTMTRIITRGILVTTRGKVLIKNNHFVSTTMSGILLSDDAHSWYESGMCEDVTIENNVFDYCGETPILIKPENKVYEGAVHKNIKIIGNEFKKYDGVCIDAYSTDNILIKNNKFLNDNYLKADKCNNVVIENQ